MYAVLAEKSGLLGYNTLFEGRMSMQSEYITIN